MIAPVPKTNAMLICDQVITEQETNKKSLIGIFEHIGAAQFPATHHAMSVYVKLTDAQGSYHFHLALFDLKNETAVADCPIPEAVPISSPLQSHELVFNLRGLKFPHPGENEFRIFANDRIFGQKTFVVNELRNK